MNPRHDSAHLAKSGPSPGFVTTQWTRVLQARGDSDEARTALSDLCAAYYAPVFSFIRREQDEENARDLTQEFFATLLRRDGIAKIERARGRFRSYLLGAVKHFLADQRDRKAAAKRAPEETPVASSQKHSDTTFTTDAEARIADPKGTTPDIEFDRKWAIALLDRALEALQKEHETDGKHLHFQTLKPWLTGDIEELRQSTAATALQMSEAAVKVAIHRLRRRFRDHVKLQIAATLPEPDPALVADEMGYLLQALTR